MNDSSRSKGIQAAAASAIFLGLAPIFGKQAILIGFSPLAVVALRTGIAVLFLVGLMALFQRPFFYIHPIGLVGCILAGLINGLGSILYYTGLSRIDASIGQLIYSFYPIFLAFWLLLDRQPIHLITAVRIGFAGCVLAGQQWRKTGRSSGRFDDGRCCHALRLASVNQSADSIRSPSAYGDSLYAAVDGLYGNSGIHLVQS